MKNGAFLILILIFLGSCTIEKRLYNKGYHVEFQRSYKSTKNKNLPIKSELLEKNVSSDKSFPVESEVVPTSAEIRLKDTLSNLKNTQSQQNETNCNQQIMSASTNTHSRISQKILVPKEHYPENRIENKVNASLSGKKLLQKERSNFMQKSKSQSMTREDFWSYIADILFWIIVIGLIILVVAYPIVGVILLILVIVGIVLLIRDFFEELFGLFGL